MKNRIVRQFFVSYLSVFALVILATALAVALLAFASRIASGAFAKSRYPAGLIMRDDYRQIDPSAVVAAGGSVNVVDRQYRILLSRGAFTIPGKDSSEGGQLSAEEFTDFLIFSKSKTARYHHDILYNPEGEFWLAVTFPASIRLGLDFVFNRDAAPGDFGKAAAIFGGVIAVFLLLLAGFTAAVSKITAAGITVPLKKLTDGTRLLKAGDYSARVDLRLKNEFAQLQDTFNDMAARLEREIGLRQRAEEDRRRLVLDVSHDLKNPLAAVQGFAELLCHREDMDSEERVRYLRVIQQNSHRANQLLTELFELSRLDSPDFALKARREDICEILRQSCAELTVRLESAGFGYAFDIPDESVFVCLDTERFDRLIQNLAGNALKYNPPGTEIRVGLTPQDKQVLIDFCDNGNGIPESVARNLFEPFVSAAQSPHAKTGGSGLGLSIAKKIALAHGGDICLLDNGPQGSCFRVTLPKI